MKRLLTFIRTLLPKCGAPFFQSQADKRMWGDLHCSRPRWHKGPHFWANTEKPSYPPDPDWAAVARKRRRYRVSQANNPARAEVRYDQARSAILMGRPCDGIHAWGNGDCHRPCPYIRRELGGRNPFSVTSKPCYSVAVSR